MSFGDTSLPAVPAREPSSSYGADKSSESPAPGVDPYKNIKAVSQFMSDRYRAWSRLRYVFERDQYRNILYFAGNQWVVYDKSSRQYTKRNLPGWFPRQITNKFAEKANDIIASVHIP